MSTTPEQLLTDTFELETFRPGQREVIAGLLAGRSALAVFPTGGGKSLCYQLPALLLAGVTLVVSPLIALMKDQVDALRARGVAAARLDSTLSGEEAREIFQQLERGALRLLYIAPERLSNERFLNRLRRLSIGLLAVDEAHCISEWGHNFRPDYLKIARLAEELRVPRVLALTATATPAVAADICKAFHIEESDHVQTGFRRPNLAIRVTPCGPADRLARLSARLAEGPPGPTIVYVTFQRTAETVARHLRGEGFVAEAYHAGMADEDRTRIQEAFMRDEVRVIVATIAFGMGIDKADIRAIYHYNLPKTLENYAQEIGRAGRDGLPSVCETLACADDRLPLENFTYGDTPTSEALGALVEGLAATEEVFDLSTYELATRHDIKPLVISTALTYLEHFGILSATGPFHAAYKVQFLKPEDELLARFDAPRADFLRRLFAAGRMGHKWLHLAPKEVAEKIGERRERIVTALSWMEERGMILTTPALWRQGYRRLRHFDVGETRDRLVALFHRREEQDIARMAAVLAFAESEDCLTRRLVGYFGEAMDDPCGTCTSCTSPGPRSLPSVPPPPFGPAEEQLVDLLRGEAHAALSQPRQLTRFLCGLTSPAATRARITRDPRFGALRDHPFAAVHDLVSSRCRAARE